MAQSSFQLWLDDNFTPSAKWTPKGLKYEIRHHIDWRNADIRYLVEFEGVTLPAILDRNGKVIFAAPRKSLAQLVQLACSVGVSLKKADLYGASLRGVDFTGTAMPLADLRFADLRDCILNDVNMQNARIEGAQWTGAEVNGCTCMGPVEDET